MSGKLRTEPDPARLECWCRGWGYFSNTAFDPPELTYCGNCEAVAEPDPFAGLSELEQDLILARLGDYPGPSGCRRIAAAYDALALAAAASGGDVKQAPGEAPQSGAKRNAQGDAA